MSDRVTNPDLLTSASTKSAPMDFGKIRKTEDKKVSVVDVIAQMKNCTQHYAAQLYKQLVREERVPDCEMRSIARASPPRAQAENPPVHTPLLLPQQPRLHKSSGSYLVPANFAKTVPMFVSGT